MSLRGFTSAAAPFALAAALMSADLAAQTRSNAASTTTTVSANARVGTLLDERIRFALPPGYVARPIAAGSASDGTAGSSGTLYASRYSLQLVVARQARTPTQVTDNDVAFLDSAAEGFVSQQKLEVPDFAVDGRQSLTLGTLGVRRVDATGTLNDTLMRTTSLLVASGRTLGLLQIVSPADGPESHRKLVDSVLGSVRTTTR